jgi:hypothetical protein
VNKKNLVLAVLGTLVAVLVAGCITQTVAGDKKPAPAAEGKPTPAPTGDGWVNLLDEQHAAAWKNVTDKNNIFEFKDGVLHIFGSPKKPLRYAGYTAEEFGDFDLHVEFKVAKAANSGLFLRAQPEGAAYRGFELQVQDDFGTPPDKNTSGAVYDVVSPMFNMSRPAGEWNSFDISVQGGKVVVIMNGWKVIDTDFALMTKPIGKFKVPYAGMPAKGKITLQDHYGEAWYRNIVIKKK